VPAVLRGMGSCLRGDCESSPSAGRRSVCIDTPGGGDPDPLSPERGFGGGSYRDGRRNPAVEPAAGRYGEDCG